MSHSDRGSAPIEFLAFGVTGFLALIAASQIIFAGYLSLVAYDVASEGATLAATADASGADVLELARVASASIVGGLVPEVSVDHRQLLSASTSRVVVRLTSPLLGFGGITIEQSSQAVDEYR